MSIDCRLYRVQPPFFASSAHRESILAVWTGCPARNDAPFTSFDVVADHNRATGFGFDDESAASKANAGLRLGRLHVRARHMGPIRLSPSDSAMITGKAESAGQQPAETFVSASW
jgi:hypothetical protein